MKRGICCQVCAGTELPVWRIANLSLSVVLSAALLSCGGASGSAADRPEAKSPSSELATSTLPSNPTVTEAEVEEALSADGVVEPGAEVWGSTTATYCAITDAGAIVWEPSAGFLVVGENGQATPETGTSVLGPIATDAEADPSHGAVGAMSDAEAVLAVSGVERTDPVGINPGSAVLETTLTDLATGTTLWAIDGTLGRGVDAVEIDEEIRGFRPFLVNEDAVVGVFDFLNPDDGRYESELVGLSVADGSELWRVPGSANPVGPGGVPTIGEGWIQWFEVVEDAEEHPAMLVDPSTGNTLFKADPSVVYGAFPGITPGVFEEASWAYLQSLNDSDLVLMRSEISAEEVIVDSSGAVVTPVPSSETRVFDSLGILMYEAIDDGALVALDARSGEELWRIDGETKSDTGIDISTIVSGVGALAVPTDSGIALVDAATGKQGGVHVSEGESEESAVAAFSFGDVGTTNCDSESYFSGLPDDGLDAVTVLRTDGSPAVLVKGVQGEVNADLHLASS